MSLYFQLRNGHQQRFTCGSQHRPPSFDGTYTLFIPSSEVVPERLALLLAAPCDSSTYGEQYRTVGAKDRTGEVVSESFLTLQWFCVG